MNAAEPRNVRRCAIAGEERKRLEPVSLASGLLFKRALAALRNLEETAPSETAPQQEEALAAIVFSALTLEALVFELEHCARVISTVGAAPRIGLLSQVLSLLENDKAPLKLKLFLAKSMVSRNPYDRATLPFQDLELLVSLRDKLVHLRPVPLTKRDHAILRTLIARGACEPLPNGLDTGWLFQVLSRGTARWACRQVAEFVAGLQTDFRAGGFGLGAEKMLGEVWGLGIVLPQPSSTLGPRPRGPLESSPGG